MKDFPWKLLLLAAIALAGAGVAQRQVEDRRRDAKLTWADPQDKDALEIGFMALGGFRGLLADVLWFKAQTQQDSAHYYDLKLLCDLIQKLQPTFTQVHSFQADTMAYNIANHAESCEDKWYWIRSGLAVLEKGAGRTRQNYNLWFSLGHLYFHRLGDQAMEDCKTIRDRELPNIDELSDEQIETVFSSPKTWVSGHARRNENLRFAAYFYWKSIQTHTEINPLRTERMYGECLEHLGMWYSAKPVAEWKKWSDGGSEPWYVDLRKRNPDDLTTVDLLRWCMYQQIYTYAKTKISSSKIGDMATSATNKKLAEEAYARFKEYFPEDKQSMPEIYKKTDEQLKKMEKIGLRPD